VYKWPNMVLVMVVEDHVLHVQCVDFVADRIAVHDIGREEDQYREKDQYREAGAVLVPVEDIPVELIAQCPDPTVLDRQADMVEIIPVRTILAVDRAHVLLVDLVPMNQETKIKKLIIIEKKKRKMV